MVPESKWLLNIAKIDSNEVLKRVCWVHRAQIQRAAQRVHGWLIGGSLDGGCNFTLMQYGKPDRGP